MQSLPSNSPYHKVWESVLNGEFQLCVNTEIARLSTTYFQDSYYHFGLITEDPDDNKFVDCAIAADAELIVTNDKHFDVLRTVSWPKLTIIKLKEFAALI